MILKIYKSIDELENQMILKTALSVDGTTLGMRTQSGVIFITSRSGTSLEIIENYSIIEHEILEGLDLQLGLVSKKDIKQTR